jgi:disulfide oxidoreductase YuzD
MTTRRTVPVEIDVGTVALAELAAAHHGMSVAEWIAKAARREFARINPSANYVDLTAAEMVAEDAERADDEATIAADEAKRFRAAG